MLRIPFKLSNAHTRLKYLYGYSDNLFNNGWLGILYRSTTPYSTKSKLGVDWIEPVGTRTGIHLYNTLSRQKNELILPRGNHLSWYICGPTVYDSSHIGHASNYVRFDIIRRILANFFDINVTYLMGVTDIDDKIIDRAKVMGQEFTALSRHYEKEFLHEMLSLNIMQPTMMSRVTDHVPEIIQFTKNIIDKGHAYKGSDGSVYFDVKKYGKYYKFHPDNVDETIDPGVKRNQHDFALWKAVKPGEPYWSSPFGDGRPGWHIECSTMAGNVFGSSVDFHSGGVDLMFPHHENEIAQSCSHFDVDQWCNYWLHTGFLHLQHDAEKMSKSLKNVIPTKELLRKYTANQFRMFCMTTHYRSNIEFTDEKMTMAVAIDNKIGSFLRQCDTYIKGLTPAGDIPEAETMQMLAENHEKVMSYLKDDFNTPQAMKCLLNLISTMNVNFKKPDGACRSPGVVAAVQLYVKRICKKLGFHKKGWRLTQDPDNMRLRQVLDHTIAFRYRVRDFALNSSLPNTAESTTAKEAKKARQQFFAPLLSECDNLRADLGHCNINVQDLKSSSTWEFDDAHMSDDSEWEDSDTETKPPKASKEDKSTKKKSSSQDDIQSTAKIT